MITIAHFCRYWSDVAFTQPELRARLHLLLGHKGFEVETGVISRRKAFPQR
jgi:hypothetical protein